MTLENLFYFIAWLLFGAFCRVLAFYTNVRIMIGEIISHALSVLYLFSVIVLLKILLDILFSK